MLSCSPGGTRCSAGRCQAGQLAQAPRVPHRRVAVRREAVEEEGVDARHPLGQPRGRGAEGELQGDAAALEAQAMQIVRERRPLSLQLRGEFGNGRIARPGHEVGGTRRMQLDGEEVEPLAALRIVAPGCPSSEEVVAQAEAGLGDHEARAAAPALGQAVAGEEDVARLLERAGARVVDVAESGGEGQAFGRALDARGDDGRGLHAARAASQASRRSRALVRPR